jgi:hypothetical protein
MTLNSSSIVCLRAHSAAVTYLHLLMGWRFFFGFGGGNFGFFTVFREVVDDIPPDGVLAFIDAGVRDGGEELDVVGGTCGASRQEHEYVTVAIVDGG